MDYLRRFLVPFRPASLLMIGIFTLAITFFLWAARLLGMGSMGLMALFGATILNIWVLKYCFVLIERVAQGDTNPPVMDSDTLSPFELRPWTQGVLIAVGVLVCYKVEPDTARILAAIMLLLFPATVALIAMGDNFLGAINPLSWFRVIRGLGPLYLVLLCILAAIAGIGWLLWRAQPPDIVWAASLLVCEVGFFGMVGASIWLRRKPLGYEPSQSPERSAARAESERVKVRAQMMDEVFQQVRMGKHVDATAPLAKWLRDVDEELAVRDALHVAEQALKWGVAPALNPIGSTLIRHLLRFGRPDAALAVFEMMRQPSPTFTMDSAADLRTLAEYAESVGKETLAQSMRLETPVHRPM